MSCFIKQIIYDFIAISNRFIAFNLFLTEKRTQVNKGCNIENHIILKVFTAVPYLLPLGLRAFEFLCFYDFMALFN